MRTLAEFGLWHMVAPLFLWVPLFAVAAGLLGLSTVRRARKQLVAAKQKTRLPTALIGVFLLVLLPLLGGFLGGTFALKRGLGRVIDEGGDQVTAWAAAQAAASLDVRERHGRIHLTDLLSRWHQRHEVMETPHGPLAIFHALPQLFEQRFWNSIESFGAGAMTWDDLVVRSRLVMREKVLHPIADQLRESAWGDLVVLLAALAVAHTLALGGVWLVCRKRLTVET